MRVNAHILDSIQVQLSRIVSKTKMRISKEMTAAILSLGEEASEQSIEDILYYMLDALEYSGQKVTYDEFELKEMTASMKRIIKQYTNEISEEAGHIVLVLDRETQKLPWESIPALRGKSVTRIPNWGMLRDRLKGKREADQTSVYYVVNPEGDLRSTQETFGPYVKAENGWQGVIGEAPSSETCLSALQQCDIYLYMGHGSGEQYVSTRQLRESHIRAITLLIGCGSGRLREAGDFEPYGMALEYLKAGSPALVGNLWDVTDRDIDRFAYKMLHGWREKGESLAAAVAASRDACRLRFLNGAAPVVYGLPIFLR